MSITKTEKKNARYWGGNGKHPIMQKCLENMVPARGNVEDKFIQGFLAISRIYYDYYNNGWGNMELYKSFCSDVSAIRKYLPKDETFKDTYRDFMKRARNASNSFSGINGDTRLEQKMEDVTNAIIEMAYELVPNCQEYRQDAIAAVAEEKKQRKAWKAEAVRRKVLLDRTVIETVTTVTFSIPHGQYVDLGLLNKQLLGRLNKVPATFIADDSGLDHETHNLVLTATCDHNQADYARDVLIELYEAYLIKEKEKNEADEASSKESIHSLTHLYDDCSVFKDKNAQEIYKHFKDKIKSAKEEKKDASMEACYLSDAEDILSIALMVEVKNYKQAMKEVRSLDTCQREYDCYSFLYRLREEGAL